MNPPLFQRAQRLPFEMPHKNHPLHRADMCTLVISTKITEYKCTFTIVKEITQLLPQIKTVDVNPERTGEPWLRKP